MKRLNDVFPDWKNGNGIFTDISFITGYDTPWKNDVDSITLDLLYHGNKSGSKLISPLIERLLVDDKLSLEDAESLAIIIKSVYHKNWQKLWDTLEFEYTPIENYNMNEQITENDTTDTIINTSENVLYGKTIGIDTNVNANQDNSVYGFNSIDAVPSDSQNGSNSGNSEEIQGGEDEKEINHNEENVKNRNQNLLRRGNIGVTTTQELIQSERELWIWIFFEQVFKDLDNILTLSIY